jgi:hypothetical protein
LANGFIAVHEGKTVSQFRDHADTQPKLAVALSRISDRQAWFQTPRYFRYAVRKIARSTDERTLIACIIPPLWLTNNSLNVELVPWKRPNGLALILAACSGTFAVDWACRQIVSANLNLFILDRLPLPRVDTITGRFLAHSALRLVCNHSAYEPLWREQLGEAWREQAATVTWPVLRGEEEEWCVRSAVDALVAKCFHFERDHYKHILSGFTHKSHPSAPTLCIEQFDELRVIGVEAFSRKYDPYWDIPLKEHLPEPVIDISLPESEPDAQGMLPIIRENVAPPPQSQRTRASRGNGVDPAEYNRVRQFVTERHRVASSDVQSAFGFDPARARALLKKLVEDGFAVVEGSGRATRYVARSSSGGPHVHTAGRPD